MIGKPVLVTDKKRGTTDTVCVVFYIAFTLLMLLLGLFCYARGSSLQFNTPFDPDGRGCGVDYPDYKFIYFPSPQYDSLWVSTCVQKCPDQSDSTVKCMPNSVVGSCSQNNSIDNTAAFHIYPTTVVRGSICMPVESNIRERVLSAVGSSTLLQMFTSITGDWGLILLMTAIMVGLSLIVIILIKLVAGYVVYVLYGLAFAAFVGFAIYMAVPVNDADHFVLKQNQNIAIVISVFSFVMAFVILLVFCSYKQKIQTAVIYIDQSNHFISDNYNLLMLPFILVGVLVLFLFFWLFLTTSFYSMSTPVKETRVLPFQHFNVPTPIAVLLVINVFYLVWSLFFLMHTGNCIISGTAINWQLSRKHPFVNSCKSYVFSHIGSVCAGSLLTSLLGIFKFELDEAECSELNDRDEQKCANCVKRCYTCVCCCCITFLFKCFHHAAYAYVNLTGVAYCRASSEVVGILKEEKEKWSVVAFLYLIFDQFIPVALAVLNVVIANSFIDSIDYLYQQTYNRVLAFLVIGLISYSVSQFFISVYSETIQTVFVLVEFRNRLENRQEYSLRLEGEKEMKKTKDVKPRLQRN